MLCSIPCRVATGKNNKASRSHRQGKMHARNLKRAARAPGLLAQLFASSHAPTVPPIWNLAPGESPLQVRLLLFCLHNAVLPGCMRSMYAAIKKFDVGKGGGTALQTNTIKPQLLCCIIVSCSQEERQRGQGWRHCWPGRLHLR
jgi:hypothetical protein